ncbi:phosphatidylinositol-specific phospholipase C1-like protein [Granulicella sibirica]|uniref:Calcium-dependent phosphoinositide phospholipase C n=1 Tax=Granulicella sibirica TaxID=2479048 RepID=A0A4Q0T8E2_9BACT|nr:phosphatidylinositol-specific phospholipase C1-like protein [Granulicella sibirica]RXH57881.1 hypothetical protein GRAN_1191 [Granulicella sibirica]
MNLFRKAALTTLLPLAALAQSPQAKQDATVRINQIQVIGTHNSYHAGFAPSEAAYMKMKNPKAFEALDYSHAPLDQQLSNGIHQMEIDVYADAKGGRFAHPAITQMVADAKLPADPDLDPNHDFDKPGFKVMHVVGIDQRSSCKTLVVCLTVVHTWSKAHPSHLPIFLLIETKYDKPAAKPQPWSVSTEPFTPAVFDALDAEILSVFPKDEIITPDQVRGTHATLPEAIAAKGWPTLAEARGKVVFLMDQSSMTPVYTEGHPALKGRILFTNAIAGTPDAAFVEMNTGTKAEIDTLVKQGYIVRTRTDEPTEAARTNNTVMRERALSTGAQFLSTDYPASEAARWDGHYHVEFPGGRTARCNPLNKPAGCQDDLLEGAN